MKKVFLSLLCFISVLNLAAQPKDDKSFGSNVLNPDHTVTTESSVTIKGIKIPYKAVAGTIPVYNDSGKVVAGVFFTYYERSDIKDRTSRPLVISFNGGPGTSSVWMELGYTGPHLVNKDDERYPVQAYGVKEKKRKSDGEG